MFVLIVVIKDIVLATQFPVPRQLARPLEREEKPIFCCKEEKKIRNNTRRNRYDTKRNGNSKKHNHNENNTRTKSNNKRQGNNGKRKMIPQKMETAKIYHNKKAQELVHHSKSMQEKNNQKMRKRKMTPE